MPLPYLIYRYLLNDRRNALKTKDQIEQIMVERFGKDCVIALATLDGNIPCVRFVNGYYEDRHFYVITHALSSKMKQIEKNPVVAIAGEWFTGHGKGVNLGYFWKKENASIANQLKSVFSGWIDNGHNDFSDQNTCILRIELTDGILLSHGTPYNI